MHTASQRRRSSALHPTKASAEAARVVHRCPAAVVDAIEPRVLRRIGVVVNPEEEIVGAGSGFEEVGGLIGAGIHVEARRRAFQVPCARVASFGGSIQLVTGKGTLAAFSLEIHGGG